MTICELQKLVKAEVILKGNTYDSYRIDSAYASDMMSDVLAQVKTSPVLVTGLCNAQVVRTAEMMDLSCVLFVRGKIPDEHALSIAEDTGLCILSTNLSMFETCGILYNAGLMGGFNHE